MATFFGETVSGITNINGSSYTCPGGRYARVTIHTANLTAGGALFINGVQFLSASAATNLIPGPISNGTTQTVQVQLASGGSINISPGTFQAVAFEYNNP